jgi:hypothetical protein
MERIAATPKVSTKDLRSGMHQLRQVEFHKRIVVQEQQVQRPLQNPLQVEVRYPDRKRSTWNNA